MRAGCLWRTVNSPVMLGEVGKTSLAESVKGLECQNQEFGPYSVGSEEPLKHSDQGKTVF